MNTITAQKFLKQSLDDAILVDVRSPDEYAFGHMIHSINIPIEQIEMRLTELPADKKVYVVCQSGVRSAAACTHLSLLGLKELTTIEGGINELAKNGAHFERATTVLPLMRQVQISAGSLILLSLILAQWVHVGFLFVTAFVGAGLLFAGVTGFCGMARVLAKMPWNRKGIL